MDLFEDLPGRVETRVTDQHSDFFIRNQVAVLVEHDLEYPGVPVKAGWFAMPRQLLDDLTPEELELLAERHLNHIFRPWTRPDRDALDFDVFPLVGRAERAVRRARSKALWRLREARYAVRRRFAA